MNQTIHLLNALFCRSTNCLSVYLLVCLYQLVLNATCEMTKAPQNLYACGNCRVICCLIFLFQLFPPTLCSPLPRYGNEMTKCTDVCQNRASLMLLNKGFSSVMMMLVIRHKKTDSHTDIHSIMTGRWHGWLFEMWGVFLSPSLWPHPPCFMTDLPFDSHTDGPFPSDDTCEAVKRGKKRCFVLIRGLG